MSAVETIRRAAALMRERAEAATPGPWHPTPDHPIPGGNAIVWAGQATVAEVSMPIPAEYGLDGAADREHIASWHPTVALAVADLLDNEASLIEGAERHPDLHQPLNGARCDLLLAVACDYLGTAS